MVQVGQATSVAQRKFFPDARPSSAEGHVRRYRRDQAVVFLKTREAFGGLSNMASGLPLRVNDRDVRTSEALYQACRFPHLPEVQRVILEQRSPMTAKMKSKPYRRDSRPDWDRVRIRVMRWCLRVKLAQNWEMFGGLLESTGDRPIVEESRRDAFWGAKPHGEHLLVGMNILGRLLMELRDMAREGGPRAFRSVPPPDLENFRLLDEPVKTVAGSGASVEGDRFEVWSQGGKSSRDTLRPARQALVAGGFGDTSGLVGDRDVIARIHSMVREHPVSRPDLNAALAPFLPVHLSDAEKKNRIAGHLRSLRRAGWIAFDKRDRRWKLGNRSALLGPVDARPGRNSATRRA